MTLNLNRFPKTMEKISKLSTNDEFKDVTFEFESSEKKIKCHKLILRAVSSVFDAMFNGSWKENDSAKICNITPEIFQKLIDSIYMKPINISNMEEAFDLYIAAEMYELEDLKEITVEYLVANCKLTNCIPIYDKAHKIGIQKLREKCKTLFTEERNVLLSIFMLAEEISEETYLEIFETTSYSSYHDLYLVLEVLIVKGKLRSYENILKKFPFLLLPPQWILTSQLLSETLKIAIISNQRQVSEDHVPAYAMPAGFSKEKSISRVRSEGLNELFADFTIFFTSNEYHRILEKRTFEYESLLRNGSDISRFMHWHENILKSHPNLSKIMKIIITPLSNIHNEIEFVNSDTNMPFCRMWLVNTELKSKLVSLLAY